MEFQYSELFGMVAESSQLFAKNYIAPHAQKWDAEGRMPLDVLQEAGRLGFMGMLLPRELGGAGLGYHEYIAAIEQISKEDPSIGLSVAAHNSLCANHIYKFGNKEQHQRWLPQLAKGAHLGAWALTEPGTGSDAARMKTFARKEGQDWVINGSKNFITHGKSGDVIVLICRTAEVDTKHNATAFVVEKGTKGFTAGAILDKMGMRASETAELYFDNCRIPDANRLGEVGEGFVQSMKVLDGGRISISALALGIGKGACDAAISYSKEREQFGKPISSFQAIAHKLADMATEIEAAELLTHRAAELINLEMNVTKSSAIAKLFASEMCVRVANEAVQIHGGYGYSKGYKVEKFYRDAKLCTIGEGTSEIQRVVISREILK